MATFSVLFLVTCERLNGNQEAALINNKGTLQPTTSINSQACKLCMNVRMTLYDVYTSFFMLGVLYSMGNNYKVIVRWAAGMNLPSTTPHSHEKR